MTSSITRKLAILAVLGALALTAGCANTSASSAAGAGTAQELTSGADYNDGDITELCPEQPLEVAYAKGSNNSWAQVVLAEMQAEAAKCDNLGPVKFFDAQGSQQQSISDLNGIVANGTKLIIVQPEFGQAQLPSITAAYRAGAAVVPLVSTPGGDIGENYSDIVLIDTDAVGVAWADWLHANVGAGSIAFLGGTPGAQSSQAFFAGLKKGLEAYPELTLVQDSVIDTNWDAGEKKRVTSGLISRYGQIDAFVTDFGGTDTGILDAYKEAGLALPALATISATNALGCQWKEENYPLMAVGGSTSLGREALRKALAAYLGKENSEPQLAQLQTLTDTVEGLDPKCDPALPADVDLGTNLSSSDLLALFG